MAEKVSAETRISGLTKVIRFTALEEEDIMSAAAISLPHTDNKAISAKSYVMRDLSTGNRIAESDADKVVPIASLTKLVTAIIAKRNIDPDEKITISKEVMSTYGNTAGFKTGETFRSADLMYPLLMVSSNDAAEAFARFYGRAKFIREMNEFVQSIGAYRTYFVDPSGLSEINVSTANDISIIMDWMYDNERDLLSITENKVKIVKNHTWINPTHFLNWTSYRGGKNGYTPEADRTGAALFTLGSAKDLYSVVILGSQSRDSDIIKLISKVE